MKKDLAGQLNNHAARMDHELPKRVIFGLVALDTETGLLFVRFSGAKDFSYKAREIFLDAAEVVSDEPTSTMVVKPS